MEQILLNGIKLDDLVERIVAKVSEHLEGRENQKEALESYLTREQVAKMLDISLPTLHDRCNKGVLKAYRHGKRVYFKRSEIERSMKPIPPRNG